MNALMNNPIAIVCSFLWIGFVCAISFMEVSKIPVLGKLKRL